MMDAIAVLITTPSQESAEKIGRHLVENRLAACVNLISPLTSIFRWEGHLCIESESLMIVKTERRLFDRLAETVCKLHPYRVPEIIALPILEGWPDYLNWIKDSVCPSTSEFV